MGVAQDYENLRKKKEQNDAQTTEFHVAQAYNSMFGKEEETSEKIDLASYFRERAKAKQNKSNNRENKKSSSSVKENGISLPRSEVLDRVTQARMQRKAEESAAAAKKKQEEQKAYDNMSLSEVDSRLEQLAQERAAFEKENGGALKNRFMKFATTIDPNAWDYAEKYEQNVKYLDENKAETEKLESMRLKKAQQEKLSTLPQETLKLLDEYNDARYERDGRALAHSDSEALVQSNEYTDAMEDSMSRSLRIIAILEEQGYDEKTIQELAYLRKTEQEEKEAQKMIEDSKKLAEKSTAAGFVVPRLMNLPAAAIGLYDNSSQFVENKVKGIDYGLNPNSIANAFTKSNTAMDETNMEKRDWNVNVPILGKTDLYDIIYQAAASGTDSAVRAAVGGGATGAGVLMTGEVLNKGIIDGKEKGYSDEKAIAYGLTQGLIEGITEKYSLDMILKEPKSIFGGIAKGFAAEGSEEVASNWLNRAADVIVNGNNSEIKQAYKTLTEQGVPGEKALSQIIVDMIGEDAESFLIGGLSGAGMSAGYHAPRATMQKISENQLQKQLGENIIASEEAQNLAKTVSETEDFQGNTRLQRSAERVLQTESNRQNAKQVGRVYQLAMEMASEADAKQQAENLDNAISQRLSELGENNAERVAPVLSKVIRGGTLTQTEAKTADTKAARQVLSEYFTPQQNDWVSKTQTKTRGQELADLLNRRQPITSEEAQRPVVAIAQTTEEGKNKQIGGTISEFAPRKLTVKAIHPTGIQFETENGQIVEDNQLIFNTDSAANFYRRATENGNVLFANLAIAAYDGSVGVDQYMTAAQRFYEAGRNGQNFSSVRKTNIVGQYLSESIAQQFYNLGANTANVEFAGIQKLYSDTDFNRAKRKGGVVKNYSQKLTGEAQAFVRFADSLGKKYGIAVVICDTIDGGNTNGFMKGNELYIALDAKGDLYMSVAGHELFHFIEQNSKSQAKKLRRLVLEQLRANEDFDYEAEIARYRDIYGEQYTTEELEEELVADSMFDVFDEAFVRKIVETDRTLAEKIRDFFTEFFEFLTGRSAEFTHLSRYFEAKPYEEIRDLFESALEDASENYKNEHEKTPEEAEKTNSETKKKEVRFSLNKPVEEARELIAVHNVRADKLLEALRLGGLPSPSIAILRANMADEIDKFGEISLVFSKETVDPKANQNNRIYSSDAYTPTKVNTEYEIAEEKAEKTYEKMRNVLKNAPEEYKSKIVWFTPSNLEDLLNRFGGEKGLEESYANDMGMKQIYLIAHGKNPVAPVYREVREEVTQADRELYDYLLDAMGDEILTGTLTRNWYQKNGDLLRKNYGQFFKERFEFDEAQIKAIDDNMKGLEVVSIARKARQYRENGPVIIRKEEDVAAYKRKIDEAVPQKEYELWIKELFTGIEGRKGIWKGEDPYDSAGNRKPWEELYREYTLQNIVSAMNEQQAQGKSFLVSNIFGGAAERFQSIEQVRERKDRLKKVNETEYNRMRENILSRYDLLCESMTQGDDFFSVSDVVVEAIAQSETQKEFLEYLRRELKGWANYDPNAAKEIWGIIEEIRAMPVGYFEAKPQRAVYFNEVYEAVIPDNADKTLKTALDEAGVHYETYRAGDSTDRAKKLNGMEQIRFSKNSKYNEYETLRMQWANSAATEAGDMAILNRKGREFVLLEATGNDTIELMKGTYKKVRSYYERTYGETIHRIYEHIESIKAEQNRDTGDLLNAGNRRHAVRDAGQDGRKGLQTDTAGNDEHLRGRHQGTSFRKSLNDTRTVNSLVKENEKLREALELAKRELQLTKGHKMNPKQVEALARGILRKTSSRYSQKTLTENLTRIFEYIANDKEANYSVAIDAMADLSKAVLEESYVKNDSLYTQYKDMREYFRKTAIRLSETAKEEIPEYELFRKENLGRLRISEKGIELDALWGEISQQWPEFFPQDTQEAQQVYLIADALDAVQPTYENPYGYDMDEAAYDLALEMYDRYFDVAEIHTFADKKRREIQLLKAEYRQKLQEKHKEDKAAFDKSLKEVKAEYKNRMKSVTSETAKRIQQIQRAEAAKRITMREKHIETERKQMVRRQIISKTKALNNMLVNPTDQKHIPEALKKQILAFCKEMSKTGIFTRERLLDLKDRYNAIEKQANSDYESYMLYGVYDEDAADLIGKLADTIGGKRLSQLDLKELGDVRKVVEQLRFMVENENQLFATEKKETVTQAGESIIADLQKKKQRPEIAGLTKLQDYFALGCAKPVYFFKYIGGPFQELYNRVAQGEADYARTVDDAKKFFEKTAKKYDFYQWCDQKDGLKEQPKREIRFETERGESVALSVEEALSIYATGRRKQGVDHLMEGGYQLSKGNIKTQTGDKGSLIKRYIDNTVIKLTESDLLKVSESLTQQQRDFADEMVRYLSTDMAALGNTVSLRMNGLKKFNESYYFPIKSTRNFLYTTQRTHQVDNRIKHKGMTKRVTPGASNPINIAPFSDVWTDHCVDMAEYYALSLPLEDFNRVYNYKAVTDGGNEITVKEALKNIYGKKAQDYIDKLMEDINGGVTVRNTEGFSDNMIAKFKKSKVVLSFTVTLKQAASLPRAFALIEQKYLLKQNRGQSFDAAWNELKKYAPVAIIKEIGSFDTNLRTRTGDWIKEREYDRVFVKGQSAEQSLQNLVTKSKALLLDSTYRDNVLTDMPGKVDQAVWIMLWNASKAEVQEKNPKLSGEELLQKAGQRFTEIIQFTQVYDSVFSRPQFLRSSSQVTKMASAFMAEPLTSLNMLADGIIRRKDGAYLTRVFASYIASAFFEVVVSSIWYAARDDDDDKTFLEKYAVSVITNFLQNLNPLNMIPFLSDVVNIFSGYDVERSDMGLVTDLYDATTGLWDEDKSAGEKLFGVLGTVGNFFGIPLENVVRDTKAFGNLIGEIGNDGGRTTTASGIWNGVLEEYEYGLSGKFITPKSEAEQYVDAMLKGDRETAEKIYQNMESGGKDESKINSAVRAVLKENEQIRKAAEARANGDTETYIQIAKSMISRGFSQDVVVGAINSATNQLEKEKEAEAESEDVGSIESAANEAEKTEKATSFYSTQDVIKSLESGNTQSAQKAVLDIYNTKVENKVAEGKTKKEADKSARSSIKSALTSEYKARYVNGTASERSKIQKMLKSIYINGKPLYENKDFSSWLKD